MSADPLSRLSELVELWLGPHCAHTLETCKAVSKAWRTASLRLASHGSVSSADAKRAQEAYSAPLDAAEQLADNDEAIG